jgi:uncharacterized coiled-coil protein SlyX
MGKLLKALKGIQLTSAQKLEISNLDRRLTYLEEFFKDQQTTMKEHGFLEEPPTPPKARVPFNEEQGTGQRLQNTVIMGRRRRG